MNALVGEKLCIVTAKAQTTRHRIMGIINGEDWQIVFSDTPGILKPNYRLQQTMLDCVDEALGDADVILYVTDTVEKADKNAEYVQKLKELQCPVIVVVNKIDISDQDSVVALMEHWKQEIPGATVIPASAQEQNVKLTTLIIGLFVHVKSFKDSIMSLEVMAGRIININYSLLGI